VSFEFRFWILAAALMALPAVARAESSDDAFVTAGLRLRREGRDREALEQFRRAEAIRPAPRTLAQIALAEQALGQWVEAEKDLRKALAQPDDPWIATHQETLKTALLTVEKHLGTLEIQSNVDGELWLNGSLSGRLPLPPMRVVAGTFEIELRHPDHAPVKRSVVVPEGRSVTENIEFISTPPPPAPPPALEPPRRPAPVPNDRSQPLAFQRTLAWVALGSAGTVLGGAVIAQLVAQNAATHYNDDSLCFYGTLSRDQRCGAYRGRAETAQTLATVGYVAAGTLGLASAILFLTLPDDAPKKPVALWIDAGPRAVGIGVQGRM
jgi:tetratricopeptide (TPR) repeat protein